MVEIDIQAGADGLGQFGRVARVYRVDLVVQTGLKDGPLSDLNSLPECGLILNGEFLCNRADHLRDQQIVW